RLQRNTCAQGGAHEMGALRPEPLDQVGDVLRPALDAIVFALAGRASDPARVDGDGAPRAGDERQGFLEVGGAVPEPRHEHDQLAGAPLLEVDLAVSDFYRGHGGVGSGIRRYTNRRTSNLLSQAKVTPMKIAVIHDYAGVFKTTRAYPKLAAHDVRVHTDAYTDPKRVVEQVKGCEALVLTQQRVTVTREVIAQLPELRFIAQTGGNLYHLDVA